jgi:hypothetical protein
MTVPSVGSSFSSLGAISKFLAAPIQKNSHVDVSLLHGGRGRLVLFSVLRPIFTKEKVLDQA